MKFSDNKLYIFLFLAGFTVASHLQGQQIKRKVKETFIAKIDGSKLVNNSFSYSNNMKRIAYCLYEGDKQIAVIDGIKGQPFEKVNMPFFSPDSKYFTYSAHDGKKWIWITGEKKEKAVDTSATIAFQMYGPDNKNIVYILNDGSKFFLKYKGIKSKSYNAINANSIVFSKDGNSIAFTATQDKKQLIVLNDEEQTLFDQVGFPVLSADGKHLGFWAINGNKSFAVIDKVQSRAYENVSSIIFSDHGNHFAYQAVSGNKNIVIYDSTESEKYDVVHSLCFNPDGLRLAYGVELAKPRKEDFKHHLVIDGKISAPYETVVENSLKFSSDGKSFAFEGENHDQFFMVLNGADGKHYSDVMQFTATFSPDNLRFAYVAENEYKRFINADTVEGKPFQDIYSIAFSPNSRWFAYSARLNDKELIIVEDNLGSTYDSILANGQIIFDAPNRFHYMAMKDKKIILVEEKISVK